MDKHCLNIFLAKITLQDEMSIPDQQSQDVPYIRSTQGLLLQSRSATQPDNSTPEVVVLGIHDPLHDISVTNDVVHLKSCRLMAGDIFPQQIRLHMTDLNVRIGQTATL